MRRVDVFCESPIQGGGNADRFRINCPCGEMREEEGAGFVGWEESQELGHVSWSKVEGRKSKVSAARR